MLINASELTASPGKSVALRALVPQMRDTLAAASGKDWSAWSAVSGRPYGTFMLSSRYENYADMLDSLMKVALSEEWASLSSNAAGVLDTPAPTVLSEVVAATGDATGVRQFVLVTRAVVEGTAMMDAIGWATEIAEYVTKVTGVGVTLCNSAAGQMFQVTWLSGVDTPAELDAMNSINTDPGYLERLAAAGTSQLFQQGASERFLLSKML